MLAKSFLVGVALITLDLAIGISQCLGQTAAGNSSVDFVADETKAITDAYRTLPQSEHRRRVNSGTVGVISDGIGGADLFIATDLASVLDDPDGYSLRILPMAGKGGIQNIRDLLYLKGVDLAIVQADILNYIEKESIFSSVKNRIHYITKLYNVELHVVAKRNIKDIRQLQGRKVNFWHRGSSTSMTAQTIFETLNLDVKPVHLDQALGLEKVKKGEIAASMLIVAKPSNIYSEIKPQDGLHLVPIKFEGDFSKTYLPARFTSADYPSLVQKGKEISTIASSAVLAVFNWAPNSFRYKKVEKFVNRFFLNFSEFKKPPRHEKWNEINLAAQLPGWIRFRAAERWLALNRKTAGADIKTEFNAFMENYIERSGQDSLSPSQQDALFDQFVSWWQKELIQ